MQNQIIAAADGSALGNPGPAGWAWYIDENHWAAGGWEHGTNNMGEIKAVLDLFEATAHRAESKLLIYCDSQYVINSLTQWMPGWKKRGWKKADGKPVQNRDLLEALDAASTGRDYEMVWVKGHTGHKLNEAADSRANAAAQAFKEGREPETGPGFPGSPHTAGEQSTPSAQAPQTREAENHAHAQDPDTLAADAHLSLEDFTETEVERARQGFDSLKLNGILKPASAVTAPDPQAVQERKTKLAEASARAAEREAQAQQRALAEQENNSQGSATENAVPEESALVKAAPAGTAAPEPAEPEFSAPNPEDAVHAERELEMRGGSMSESEISALLHERLVWVTATGRSVSRADTIAYRARAFTQQGSPAKQGVQVVDDHNVLIMAAVQTARGRVNRSSLWHYDTTAAPNGWRLRFRQETTAS
ncbi:RNase H family protein [Rothia dentocariosa]|uniref:RNase H family protein n=1 Tax=Rothia dentocariosa TaxID=2047 RepID=UPI00248F4B6C|nr:RNase H family protein [Rothia dentocariosa]